MKILYIENGRLPTEKAHGYQIAKMCAAFAAAGADVELACPGWINPLQEEHFSFYGQKPSYRLKRLPSPDLMAFFGRTSPVLYYLQSLLFLLRLCLLPADRGSIVYTRRPEIAWLFKTRGFRVLYECHDWFQGARRLPLFLLKRADMIVATNRQIRQGFLDNGFSAERLLVAPNGVDLSVFRRDESREEAIRKLSLPPEIADIFGGRTMLLYTGSYKTMGTEKGVPDIISALSIIKDDPLSFAAVGGSAADIAEAEALARAAGVSASCRFLGRETQERLALWQRAADILLMPFPDKAHYREHMAPLQMFEYLAAGRPIISSDLPSLREFMTEENCLFCRPGDPDDLARKIRLLRGDQALAGRLAQKSRQDSARLDWSERAIKIIAFINRIDNKD